MVKLSTNTFSIYNESDLTALRAKRKEEALHRADKYNVLKDKYTNVCMWCLSCSNSNSKLSHEDWCRNN